VLQSVSDSSFLGSASEVEQIPAQPATLDKLAVGSSGIIGSPATLSPTVLRLLEMGLTPGTPVKVTRRAPGGDPLEIRIRGTRLCIRHADAAQFRLSAVAARPPNRP
jgi:ferrous iron transport protein B